MKKPPDIAPPSIHVCPAGCVRLQFGPAFVVLPRDVFRRFAAAVADALRALDRSDSARPRELGGNAGLVN